jgi:parallel beta-helix repeat protein
MDSMDNCRERVEALERRTQMVEQRPRWWRGIACGVVTLLGALGITLGSATAAHAHDIQCGDVLGPGGRFELEHDLECGSHAVTVRDGAILDLNGHIVACRPLGFECIILTGAGAQLLNGAVEGRFDCAIILEGTGGHLVRNVTSVFPIDISIAVRSDHNQLINVMAESSASPAFSISGNHNRLTDSIARCGFLRFGGCITVGGDGNRLIDNFATSTRLFDLDGGGFLIAGNNNVLRGNRAIGDEGPGILVTGTGNILSHNTALRNTLDLQDTSGDCAQNTWRQNTFRTSDPACIDERTGGAVAAAVE